MTSKLVQACRIIAVCSSVWLGALSLTSAHAQTPDYDAVPEADQNPNVINDQPLTGGGPRPRPTIPPSGVACGDHICCFGIENDPANADYCPADCDCGNGQCEPNKGEDLTTCPADCGNTCGDQICQPWEQNGGCPCDCHVPGDGFCCPGENDACCQEVCGNHTCNSACGETPTSCGVDCTCGNGQCDNGETHATCAQDCHCGDGACNFGETTQTCSQDCTCGNGTCDPGENFGSCPDDCGGSCGNGQCEANLGETSANCPADCTCGNGVCDGTETVTSCPQECHCGDGACNYGETFNSCESDCPPVCGNGQCEAPNETVENCRRDCGFCGDGTCTAEAPRNETSATCPQDCGPVCGPVCQPGSSCPGCGNCGNQVCDQGEQQTCPQDCRTCPDGVCQTGENCPQDCNPVCGNSRCEAGEDFNSCPQDCDQTDPSCNMACMPGFKQFSAQVYDAAHQIQIRICICCPNDPLIGAGFDHHTGQFGCFRYCGNLQDPNACGGCFAPETKILMSDQSYKLVSSLKVGDKVWNPVTGKAAEVYTVSHGPERIPMVQIGFDQSAVEVTDGHPMVINNKAEEGQMLLLESLIAPASLRSETRSELPRGYQVKRADQVKVGDRILGADGRFHTVNVARMLPVRPGQMVHNFIVNPGSTNSDDHMVMADGLVVGDLYLQNKLKKESK